MDGMHDGSRTDNQLAEASFSPRHADLIRRVGIEEQMLEDGRLDYDRIFRRDAALSQAVDRYKKNETAHLVAILGILATVLGILLKWLAL